MTATPIRLSVLIPCWNQEELAIRALDSIPRRHDIEVIAWDDGSTDRTLENLLKYRDGHPELNLHVYSNPENRGCAYTCNRLLEKSSGEYFHFLGNDDYVLTEPFEALMARLGEADIICFDLRINNGDVWVVDENTRDVFVAQTVRFIRKSVTEGLKFPEEITGASDWYFNRDLMKRNPTMIYTNVVAYHYNHPRVGSLCWLRHMGMIEE